MFSNEIKLRKIKVERFEKYKNFSIKDFTLLFSKLAKSNKFKNYNLCTKIMINKNTISFFEKDCIDFIKSFDSFNEAVIYYFNNDYYDNMEFKIALLRHIVDFEKINWDLYYDKEDLLLELLEFNKCESTYISLLNIGVSDLVTDKIIENFPYLLMEKDKNDEFFIFSLPRIKLSNDSIETFFFNFQGNIKSKCGKNILMIKPFNEDYSLFTKILETNPNLLLDTDMENKTLFHYIRNKNILYEIFINDFRLLKEELTNSRMIENKIPINLISELISVSEDFENFIIEYKDIIFNK